MIIKIGDGPNQSTINQFKACRTRVSLALYDNMPRRPRDIGRLHGGRCRGFARKLCQTDMIGLVRPARNRRQTTCFSHVSPNGSTASRVSDFAKVCDDSEPNVKTLFSLRNSISKLKYWTLSAVSTGQTRRPSLQVSSCLQTTNTVGPAPPAWRSLNAHLSNLSCEPPPPLTNSTCSRSHGMLKNTSREQYSKIRVTVFPLGNRERVTVLEQ